MDLVTQIATVSNVEGAAGIQIVVHNDKLQRICPAGAGAGSRLTHVISMCGPSRYGRSFLINILHECVTAKAAGQDDILAKFVPHSGQRLDGFPWGYGDRRITNGVWMTNAVTVRSEGGEGVDVYLVDTQGVCDEFSTSEESQEVLRFCLAISDTLIFSVPQELSEDKLTAIANAIEACTMEGTLWCKHLYVVIRDAGQHPMYPNGETGGQKYLAKRLETNPHQSTEANRLRHLFCESLHQIGCSRLPFPGQEVNRPDYAGNLGLNGQFLTYLEELALSLTGAMDFNLRPATRRTNAQLSSIIPKLGSEYAAGGDHRSIHFSGTQQSNSQSASLISTRHEPQPAVAADPEELLQQKCDQCAEDYYVKLKSAIESSEATYLERNQFQALHDTLVQGSLEVLEDFEIPVKLSVSSKYKRYLESQLQKHHDNLTKKNDDQRAGILKTWNEAMNRCLASYTLQIQELLSGHKQLLLSSIDFKAMSIANDVKQHFLSSVDKKNPEVLARYEQELQEQLQDILVTEKQTYKHRRDNWLSNQFDICKGEAAAEYFRKMKKLTATTDGDNYTQAYPEEHLESLHFQAKRLVIDNADLPDDDDTDYKVLLKQFLDLKFDDIKEQNRARHDEIMESKDMIIAPVAEKYTRHLHQLVSECETTAAFEQAGTQLRMDTLTSFRRNTFIPNESIAQELVRQLENEMTRAHEIAEQGFRNQRQKEAELIDMACNSYKLKMEERRKSAQMPTSEDMTKFHNASRAEVADECRLNPLFGTRLQKKLTEEFESLFVDLRGSAAQDRKAKMEKDQQVIQTGIQWYKDRMQQGMMVERMPVPTSETLHDLHNVVVEEVVADLVTTNASEELLSGLSRMLTREQLPEFKRKATARMQQCKDEAEFFMKKAVTTHKTKLEGINLSQCVSKKNLESQHQEILELVTKELQESMHSVGVNDQAFLEPYLDQLVKEAEIFCGNSMRIFELQMEKDKALVKAQIAAASLEYDKIMNQHFKKTPFLQSSLFENESSQILSRLISKFGRELTEVGIENLRIELEAQYSGYLERNTVNTPTGDVAIGIDLGTTYSCVAVYRNGEVYIIPSAVGGNTVPSFVGFASGGNELVGAAAKNQAHENAENTIFDAKRLIGRDFKDAEVQEDIKLWPFKVAQTPGTDVPAIMAGGSENSPEMISAKVLKHLKIMAQNHLQVPNITKAVITVPAYFKDGQRQATKDAGYMAGLDVLQIVNEPTAAAMAYHLHRPKATSEGNQKKAILIYDLGGGTFDVSVLEIERGNIVVKAVNGDTHLGGEDFDQKMVEFCLDKFKAATGVDIAKLKDSTIEKDRVAAARQLRRLRNECESRKKELSEQAEEITIAVHEVFGHDLNVVIKRTEFEEMNGAKFQLTIEIVKKALNDANLRTDQIDEIVLVGGSTRIPKIQKLLTEFFGGRALYKVLNPDEAVARGAAILAAKLNGQAAGEALINSFTDVTPLSLGVEVRGKRHSVIIPRNTPVPVTLSEDYTTVDNQQTQVKFKIYEGEEREAVKNHFLGSFLLAGIPPAAKGVETITATMEITKEGILRVSARCVSNGQTNALVVKTEKGRLSQQTLDKVREELAAE